MKLLADDLKALLPALYTQDEHRNPIVYAKFFTSDMYRVWFVIEGSTDRDDFRFFGYVIEGCEAGWSHFTLSELDTLSGSDGLPVKQDPCFQPKPFSEIFQSQQQV